MLRRITSVLTRGFYRNIWLKLLVLTAFIFVVFTIYKKMIVSNHPEGFVQNDAFVLKSGANIYDGFYSQIYDTIHKPESRVKYELKNILKITQASDESIFLDIGSGTGCVLNELTELGYKCCGLDNSKAMIEYSDKKYPEITVKKGDVMDPMTFDKGVFSHALCLYYTVYHIKDKRTFFRNCYNWMQPGGYLIVHLVDKHKFDVNVPAAKHVLFGSPQNSDQKRVTDSIVKFDDFKYKVSYSFGEQETVVTETFTDVQTSKMRQNEQTLYMEDISVIVNYAKYAGFIPHGKIDMKEWTHDENQFLYFFERAL